MRKIQGEVGLDEQKRGVQNETWKKKPMAVRIRKEKEI